MLPQTRGLIELLRENDGPDDFVPDRSEPAAHLDPRTLQLQIRKKHQMGILKKMLEDAGYGDLAKMTTISKRDYDEDID